MPAMGPAPHEGDEEALPDARAGSRLKFPLDFARAHGILTTRMAVTATEKTT